MPHEVEQRSLNRGDSVYRGPQIEGLLAAPGGVAMGEAMTDAGKDLLIGADGLTDDFPTGLFQDLANSFSSGNLAGAGVACIVRYEYDIAGEKGCVGSAEVEQHAVAAGDRDNPHSGDARTGVLLLDFHLRQYRRRTGFRAAGGAA